MTGARSKGVRRERECREMYEQAGYVCASTSTGTRWGDTDLLNLFDALALHSRRRIRFVQVKSNGTGGDLREFFDECNELLPGEYAVAHFAVCYDRDGWKLYTQDRTVDKGYRVAVDERDEQCGMGEKVTEYLGGKT